MNLQEIMKKDHFVIVGDTLNKEKYAYKIKETLLSNGYKVACVGKELKSLDEVDFNIEVVDLCINPVKGLEILKNSSKNIEMVLIQPGAESQEIKDYLDSKNIPYLEGCALVGVRLYKNK